MTSKQRDSLKMNAVYMARGKIFFFDENGIYQSIDENDYGYVDLCGAFHVNKNAKNRKIKGILMSRDDRIFVIPPSWHDVDCPRDDRIVKMALSRMKEGDSIEQFEEYLKSCRPAPAYTYTINGIDRFICRIDRPIFYRSHDNLSPNTFDYIYVDVSILSENAMKERDKYLKDNISEIRKRVAEKLANSREFKKYGVPINFLRVCRTTLKRKSNVLQFVFELKPI